MEASWGVEGGRSLLSDALASSLLSLGGSWCYLFITKWGKIKALPSAGTEQCGPVPIPLLHFTLLHSLKTNPGFGEALLCTDLLLIFQILCPRTAHSASPSPWCSPVRQAQPKPFSCNLPNNRVVFLSVSDVARGIFFPPFPLLISKQSLLQQPPLREPGATLPGGLCSSQ